jgi:hypothetical protein
MADAIGTKEARLKSSYRRLRAQWSRKNAGCWWGEERADDSRVTGDSFAIGWRSFEPRPANRFPNSAKSEVGKSRCRSLLLRERFKPGKSKWVSDQVEVSSDASLVDHHSRACRDPDDELLRMNNGDISRHERETRVSLASGARIMLAEPTPDVPSMRRDAASVGAGA